jgi:hypothetical protein
MTATLMSRRVLLAGSVGLVSAAAPLPSVLGLAQEATPVPPSEEAFPAEVQLHLTQVVETVLAETYTPGALVGVWFPRAGHLDDGGGDWGFADRRPDDPR